MIRAVLDTNVIVSGLKGNNKPPSQILQAWRDGRFVLVASPQLLDEVEAVFLIPTILKFLHMSPKDVDDFLVRLRDRAFVTLGEFEVDVVSDPDDNVVVACGLEGLATHIVTGNSRHFDELGGEYLGMKIVSPREFGVELAAR